MHANFLLSGLVAADIKAALGMPFVITFHALGRVRRQFQGDADAFPDERFAIEDRIVAEADRIIAECPQDEEDLIRLYDADPSRISIVPCGFDPDELAPMSRPLARLELGLDPAERILLQLGRIVPRKGDRHGHPRAPARLRPRPRASGRLLIVGGARPRAGPRTRAGARAAAGHRRGGGHRRARSRSSGAATAMSWRLYYSAADIFVTTPWYEPFGITPLEAMACGTPVLGSNVGGIKFSVRDGETAISCRPTTPTRWPSASPTCTATRSCWPCSGGRPIRRVNDLFTWERVATGVARDLYEEVLAARRLAGRGEARAAGGASTGLRRGDPGPPSSPSGACASRSSRPRACLTRPSRASGKLLVAGNGGSAAEAQHFATELVGRFRVVRPAGPARALALPADSAFLTGVGERRGVRGCVLARQVEAVRPAGRRAARPVHVRDARANLVRAFEAARAAGLRTIALLGRRRRATCGRSPTCRSSCRRP